MTNVGNGGEAETTADHEVSPVVRKAVCPTQVGSMLDRFRLDEVLGHGVFSTVFKAFDTTLDLPVVVKVLGKNASVDAIERFRREIVFSRRLAHPGFSRIFEFHEVQAGEVPSEDAADGARLRYLTMEFIEGRTVGDLMNEGPMPERRALTIARDLCDIVAVAHEQGVVHGDLKPSNIMMRSGVRRKLTGRLQEPRDELVVLDFGAASAVDLAHAGVRVGSVRYMAPELFGAEGTSRQTDVWAVGVVLYGCLTGRLPFDGSGDRAVAEATRRSPPMAPSSASTRISPLVDEVVLHALKRSRSERYLDCREFRNELDALLLKLRAPSLWHRLWRVVKS